VQARDRLQRAAGLEDGLEGGGQLVSALNDVALRADWDALTELAHTVAELNARNGQLAAHGQRTARAALGILTGRSQQDHTYSTLRRKSAAANGYSLGKV
jgi:flagellar biosynthesis/type III secretory pathway chaperone